MDKIQTKITRLTTPIQQWILHAIKSWWVVAYVLGIGILYEQGLKEPKHLHAQLTKKVNDLQQDKKQSLEKQKKLTLQINSQNDPAWIEITLMKNLGLTPEGQRKVYFISSENANDLPHPQ